MFERLSLVPAQTVSIDIDGQTRRVPADFTVAAALLDAGRVACRRSAVGGAPRGPFCMMGVCFECLVEVDGRPNVQACIERVRDGMKVRAMHGKASIE